MSRLELAALSLTLRTLSQPLGRQILLGPLVKEARLLPTQETVWKLFETMDRMGCFTDSSRRHHLADLRRLDFRVVS